MKLGLKADVMIITVGMCIRKRGGKYMYGFSHIQYDPSMSEVGELVLQNDPPLEEYVYEVLWKGRTLSPLSEKFIRNFGKITGSRNCLGFIGSIYGVNAGGCNVYWHRSASMIGIDHNSKLLFSNLPSQFVAFVGKGLEENPKYRDGEREERQLILFVEGYSQALVCISDDSRTINIWYPV